MTERRPKLAIVASHPIQYHVFRWRALAAQPDLDVTVLYCKREGSVPTFSQDFQTSFVWDVPMLSGYRSRFFANWSWKPGAGFLSVINPGLWRELIVGDYDAVLFLGTHLATHTVGMAVARLRRRTVLVYSVCYDLDPRSGAKNRLRNLVYRCVYGLAHKVLSIGQHARAHYKAAGVAEHKLLFAPHFVDYAYFRRSVDGLDKSAARARFGIPTDAKVILFCAKMFAKKRARPTTRQFRGAPISRDGSC